MPVTMPQGSKEYLIVDVTDTLGSVADLAGTTPKFDVRAVDNSYKQQNVNATASLMKLLCLVDTTAGGTWAGGTYRLYVFFAIGLEAPRLGPYEFIVDAG